MLVTPLRILWWPGGDTDRAPQEWQVLLDIQPLESDPAPSGKQPAPWIEPPSDWRDGAQQALNTLGAPILTVVNSDGFPVPFRTRGAFAAPEGFRLDVPTGMPAPATGSACLTFHAHPDVFTGQQNMAFVGEVEDSGHEVLFHVERRLADFSLGSNKMSTTLTFLSAARRLTPQLKREIARRGQSMPKINLPK